MRITRKVEVEIEYEGDLCGENCPFLVYDQHIKDFICTLYGPIDTSSGNERHDRCKGGSNE